MNPSQRAKLHAMLGDLAKSRVEGRTHSADVWKVLAIRACWPDRRELLVDLDGDVFEMPISSTTLSVKEAAVLIDWISHFCAQHKIPMTVKEYENVIAQ